MCVCKCVCAWCDLHVHVLILYRWGSPNCLISRLRVSVVNPLASQGRPPPPPLLLLPLSSCHPLIATSTDGSFYFHTEY